MSNPLYRYISNTYDLVWFYGISIIVGYLMPNSHLIYIKYMIFEHILWITFLNKPELIFFTQLNGFTHFYLK